MYHFKGWTIETDVDLSLTVFINKEKNHLIMYDEAKNVFAWIYPSDRGSGLMFEKVSWTTQFHILPDEKKIIISCLREDKIGLNINKIH